MYYNAVFVDGGEKFSLAPNPSFWWENRQLRTKRGDRPLLYTRRVEAQVIENVLEALPLKCGGFSAVVRLFISPCNEGVGVAESGWLVLRGFCQTRRQRQFRHSVSRL
ncbi:hypothetical protein AVEN_44851-1 [Araneus ventricosus]|uniref:Uncharacterized protein n=1 Tax=Araneus ventricosus TaxID=182803 RepID=A0A4Y2CKN1_ARAVE|nr:hypothetical protein AVEN_44851-1 [Araneus ventricosus]